MSPKPSKRVAVAIEVHYTYPWHLETHFGITQYAEQNGWQTVLDPYLVSVPEQGPVGYDGVVGRITPQAYPALEGRGVPVVTLVTSPLGKKVPSVTIDHADGVRLAGEHLIACGYHRFGFLGSQDISFMKLFAENLQKVLASHGFDKMEQMHVLAGYARDREQTMQAREQLMQWLEAMDKPVGLVAGENLLGFLVIQLCRELGLRVPEDVGVLTLFGDELMDTSCSPSLTGVSYDHIEQGYQAAAMLDKLMEGRPAHPLHRLVGPDRVIVRESTDVFLCSDPMVSEAMHYIAEQIRRSLNAEDIAAHLNTSRRTLERRFEQALGRTVYSEMRRLRVDYLQRQLAETDRSISTIASECGFTAATNFCRYFKQETGMTPTQYRKRYGARGG